MTNESEPGFQVGWAATSPSPLFGEGPISWDITGFDSSFNPVHNNGDDSMSLDMDIFFGANDHLPMSPFDSFEPLAQVP
jgi:hypothetical protein